MDIVKTTTKNLFKTINTTTFLNFLVCIFIYLHILLLIDRKYNKYICIGNKKYLFTNFYKLKKKELNTHHLFFLNYFFINNLFICV